MSLSETLMQMLHDLIRAVTETTAVHINTVWFRLERDQNLSDLKGALKDPLEDLREAITHALTAGWLILLDRSEKPIELPEDPAAIRPLLRIEYKLAMAPSSA